MGRRRTIHFKKTRSGISKPVTKFGGQPVWLTGPQWPLSRSAGTPMRFIGQVEIPEDVFPGAAKKVAYIFMTDGDEYIDGTWEPNGGENAVIIQPSENVDPPITEVEPLESGPTMQRYEKSLFSKKLKPRNVEFSVRLEVLDEPDFLSDEDQSSRTDEQMDEYWQQIQGNKIGGSPAFIQFEEYPDRTTEWKLLLQLDACLAPFHLNFGDAGIGHVFLDKGATKGRLLWQCS